VGALVAGALVAGALVAGALVAGAVVAAGAEVGSACGRVAAAGAVDVAAAGEQAVMSKPTMKKALIAFIKNVLVFIKLLQIVIENMRVV
jgi:hypothetical protein